MKLKEQWGVSVYCLTSAQVLKEQRMFLLFFKKLSKFMDPVMPQQMSAVEHSIDPQKEQ